MLGWLTGKQKRRLEAQQLYARIAATARNPVFFTGFGVPDTTEGRFELLVLHLFLALERVRKVPRDGEALTQRTIEVFVTDMDDCMREMGVGDLTVPKKVKTAAAVFYARAASYRAALAEPENHPLAAMLSEFVQQDEKTTDRASRFADYVRQQHDQIANAQPEEIFLPNGAGRTRQNEI